jgi:hypothetical protein
MEEYGAKSLEIRKKKHDVCGIEFQLGSFY